ncbi:MAG: GMC family oxidoreductase [Janthinobacterium lividum]
MAACEQPANAGGLRGDGDNQEGAGAQGGRARREGSSCLRCRRVLARCLKQRADTGQHDPTQNWQPNHLSDAELGNFLFRECGDAQHASGTCRMGGSDDTRSVVDPKCRVLGCTGLRVIDASIMPEVPRANTHLTTVAIAKRMADRLR